MTERANLRAMFAPGAPSHLLARDVFTDRVGERRAFQQSVASMAGRLDQIDATDLGTPRRNVLYFYGIGGVGKSRLLTELERLATPSVQLGDLPRTVTARVDMGVSGLDTERLLLQLRADFGTALRRAQAFDLVAASYWERAHAGESISQFFRRDSLLKRHAERSGVADHMKVAIEEVTVAAVGTSVVASVGTTSARLLRDSIRSSQQYRQLTARLGPWFEHLLAADPTVENFSYLAALLAWDISEEQQRSTLLPIVFVDTLEHVIGAGRRHDEAVLQRLCFLLPNVLWVFGGRDRIEWGDDPPNAELEYSGENLWPGLSAKVDPMSEPRQHLLGNLSPDDCEQYLTDVLRDGAGAPLIPAEVRSRIASGSDGLPLYLDLAVNHFISASAGGKQADPAEFGGPLPSVVSRVLRDLAAEERRILRSACLFSRFDHDLASAASGAPSDAVVKRVLSRSYVDSSAPEPFGLSLPTALRDSIRAVDPQLDDGWSRREWSAAATRALDHLEGRWDAYVQRNDSGGAEAALTQALEVLADVQEVPRWLYDASELTVERGQWRVLRAAARSVGQDGTVRSAFCTGLAGIVERRVGSLPESVRLLQDAVNDGILPEPISDLFRLHLANASRNLGDYQSVKDEYIHLSSSSSSSVGWHAEYQLADLSYLAGDFVSAVDRSGHRSDTSSREVERLRLHGHIHRYNANFRSATRSYRQALEHADRCGGDGLRAKVETNLIETWQWSKPDQVLEEIGAVVERTERAKNALDLSKLAAVRVALVGWTADGTDLDQLVTVALGVIEDSGYQAAEIFVRMGECFAAVRHADPERAQQAANRVTTITNRLGVYRFCATICGLWVGRDVASEWPRYQWLDEDAQERWRSVAEGRPVS